jgi:DNA-binding XRE family transcriptional regulator
MAAILGISKKTLVESEKGRRSIGWTEAAALASIFSESHVIQNEFGGETTDMIKALAFSDVNVEYPKTMGGKVWWRKVSESNGFIIQQNLISQHYRLLDGDDRRLYSSFDLKDVEEYLNSLMVK